MTSSSSLSLKTILDSPAHSSYYPTRYIARLIFLRAAPSWPYWTRSSALLPWAAYTGRAGRCSGPGRCCKWTQTHSPTARNAWWVWRTHGIYCSSASGWRMCYVILIEEGEEVMLLLSRIDEHLLKHVVCQAYYLQCLHVPQCQRGYLIIGNPFLRRLGSLAP